MGSTVYVASAGPDLFKVGLSRHVGQRLAQLRTASADDIKMVHQVPVSDDDGWKVEAHAHRILRPNHVREEWFKVSLQDAISAIDAALISTAAGEPVRRHGVGRKMEYPDRITLPLAHGVLAEIDAALKPDEPRLDLIREAIKRELERRKQSNYADTCCSNP